MAKLSLAAHLSGQGFSKEDINKVVTFRKEYDVPGLTEHDRMPNPVMFYIGGQTLKLCVNTLLAGYHLLLEGGKGVGKNTLIETLAFMFKRPLYEYPFNGGTDVNSIIGEDTLTVDTAGNTIVKFKEHQLLSAMQDPAGAWFCGDEINMTRSEVLSVLHMVTDYRAKLDVPGYGVVQSHPAFRFIGTMNYGYMGTSELNEAFSDRFVIVHVPPMNDHDFIGALKYNFETLTTNVASRLVKLFRDLDMKAQSGAITSRSVTVRGLSQAIGLVKLGTDPFLALECCVTNKAFDSFERTQIKDTINTLFTKGDVWFDERVVAPVAKEDKGKFPGKTLDSAKRPLTEVDFSFKSEDL